MKNKLKEFGLTSLAIDNSTSVFLVSFMILLFGLQSYQKMPKQQYPDASMPTIFVNTPYFGNSAEEIENLISRPIEKELEGVEGIKSVNSTSIQDFSVIVAEFDASLEMSEVLRKTKDAVDKAKSELPTDLKQDPEILEINFSEIPIVTVNVSGDYSPDELRAYAEQLKNKIELIKEVSKVQMRGQQEREMKIDVDLNKMQSLKVSFTDIENAVITENLTMSGGEIVKNGFRRAVRIVGQFTSDIELENIIVKSEKQQPIYLKDIATVKYGYKERTSYARSDGYPVISLDVIKRKGKNLLAAADELKIVLAQEVNELPSDLKVSLFNDQSVNTRNEVSNLENSIISGVILVVLVLLFFLGLRNASFVGIAIPLSMLMGILFLYVSGTTMNIVVLFSLILALGLLVDNGIVVVENIYRYMQDGYSSIEAAKFGTGEVAWPIIASTATTLAAFLPLAFWPGIMGEFMKFMPITLMLVLGSSLFVALVINPVLTSRFMKVDTQADERSGYITKRKNVFIGIAIMLLIAVAGQIINIDWIRNLMVLAAAISALNFFLLRPGAFLFQNSMMPRLEKFYNQFVTFALDGIKPILFFIGTFLLLFASGLLFAVKTPKVTFFPSADPIYINTFIELPLGVDIEKTNEITKEVETKILQILEKNEQIVEAVLTQIGENTSDPNQPPEPGLTPHKARITVNFVPTQDRGGVSTREILNEIRGSIKNYAGVKIFVDKNADGPPTGKPINLEIRGDNIDTLVTLTARVKALINNLPIEGIEGLNADVNIGKPELLIDIDRAAARRYELSTFSISDALRTSVFGKEVSKYKDGEDEHSIMLRLSEKYRNDENKLINQKVTFRNPANGQIVQVPISAVATFNYSSTYSSIRRLDGQRVITLSSNLLDGYNANEIVTELQNEMSSFDLPEGYTYEFTGEQQQQAEDMAFLGGALLLAVFLIFIILVTQFNSIISPFIVILSIVFSLIGVLLGYVITGSTISVIFTGVGIISLAGVVVNNAIVLIDYINLLVRNKSDDQGLSSTDELPYHEIKNSIIEAGGTRLRPVLLTAITTVLGLIPLALGINFNFFTLISELDPQYFSGGDNTAMWGPMAWTIIYGLTFATFLTLVVIPVMYWLAYRAKMVFVKRKSNGISAL
ncbi:efflux RND transporter permease subunit [Saprospiraceae bacterium]|nr:efflux RND transporter permease subunit [Saprospiraceae bacterium]MDB4162971.1 efflux RND transporter permease subunit [Saprospiraceae bacterium]